MNTKLTRVCYALATAVALLNTGTALAENMDIKFTIPVDASRLSPNVTKIHVACQLYARDGSPVTTYDAEPADVPIGASRSFKGNLTHIARMDMATAMKTDWGKYECKLVLITKNGSGGPYPNNPDQDYMIQPGGVTIVSGSLF